MQLIQIHFYLYFFLTEHNSTATASHTVQDNKIINTGAFFLKSNSISVKELYANLIFQTTLTYFSHIQNSCYNAYFFFNPPPQLATLIYSVSFFQKTCVLTCKVLLHFKLSLFSFILVKSYKKRTAEFSHAVHQASSLLQKANTKSKVSWDMPL